LTGDALVGQAGSIAAVLFIAIAMWYAACWLGTHPSSVKASSPARPYLRQRERALGIDAIAAGANVNDPKDVPFAVVTDIGYGNGTATILTTIGGDARIYFSCDGTNAGGNGNPGISTAARWSVEIARDSFERFRRSDTFPVAGQGEVYFYLVSGDGVRSAQVSETELDRHAGAFTNLFGAVKRVLLSFRASEQRRGKEAPQQAL
jgi:hypothetical protein